MADYLNPSDGTNNPNKGYVYSMASIAGATAANVFLSLFNPAGSGKIALVAGIGISCATNRAIAALAPMRTYRVTAASAGTLVATSDVCKLITIDPDPVCVLRTGNPTVTLAQALSNTPPVVSTGLGGFSNVHEIDIRNSPLVLFGGQGVAFKTDLGDVNQFWNIAIAWAERRG